MYGQCYWYEYVNLCTSLLRIHTQGRPTKIFEQRESYTCIHVYLWHNISKLKAVLASYNWLIGNVCFMNNNDYVSLTWTLMIGFHWREVLWVWIVIGFLQNCRILLQWNCKLSQHMEATVFMTSHHHSHEIRTQRSRRKIELALQNIVQSQLYKVSHVG